MRHLSLIFLVFLFMLTACTGGTPTATSPATEPVTTTEPTAEPTPTAAPPAALTVCTVSLPESLFPYDGPRPASKDALAELTGMNLADMLTQLPDSANGGLQVEAVSVQRGQTVVDAQGELVTLKAGVTVRPSGCTGSDCALYWDGEMDLSMDQMTLSFELQDGLSWSDGTPVTGVDSVFSYNLASDSLAPGLQWAESRTASYTASDERTIIWTGKPGFTTADLERLFWMPLPAHLFPEGSDWQSTAADPVWTGALPAFGPFQVLEWGAEAVRLGRNSYGITYVDDAQTINELTLQVVAERADAVAALQSGECDVLDSSYQLASQADLLSELGSDARYRVIVGQTDSWTQLVFGIWPASYDDYYNPVYGDRPDFFGDARTRQAIAACMDRGALQEAVYGGLAEIWPSFLSPGESQLPAGDGITYDPAEAARLLGEAGWVDHDQDPATPLQAWGIGNIPQGTSLQLDLYYDQTALSESIAAFVEQSLAQCGIGVKPVSMAPGELYAPGPEGVLFGRRFDLALMAWAPMDEPDCALYESWREPDADNQWIGTNISGLAVEAFDAACTDAGLALPGAEADALRQAEVVYLDALPAIPLFSEPRVIVTTTALCLPEGKWTETEFFHHLAEAALGGEACGE
jgi:peptide/nickel transport system substrate-binding protein